MAPPGTAAAPDYQRPPSHGMSHPTDESAALAPAWDWTIPDACRAAPHTAGVECQPTTTPPSGRYPVVAARPPPPPGPPARRPPPCAAAAPHLALPPPTRGRPSSQTCASGDPPPLAQQRPVGCQAD